MKLNNKVYDILKWMAILFLPALAQLVKGVFAVWGVPYGDQIAETITYIDLFLGAVLGISHIRYVAEQGEKENDE